MKTMIEIIKDILAIIGIIAIIYKIWKEIAWHNYIKNNW